MGIGAYFERSKVHTSCTNLSSHPGLIHSDVLDSLGGFRVQGSGFRVQMKSGVSRSDIN